MNTHIEIPPNTPTEIPDIDQHEISASAGPMTYHMSSEQVAAKLIEHWGDKYGLVRVPVLKDGYQTILDVTAATTAATAAKEAGLKKALEVYLREAQDDQRQNRAPQPPSGLAAKAVEYFKMDLSKMGIRLVATSIETSADQTSELKQLKELIAAQAKQIQALMAGQAKRQ